MERIAVLSGIFAVLGYSFALAQEASLGEADIHCTDDSPAEIYQAHLAEGRVDLCRVPGTTIEIYLQQRVSPGRLTSGSMQVVLQGAHDADDGWNSADIISFRQVLPRVWEVTHFSDPTTPVVTGERNLIWSEDIELPDIRRNFTALSFGGYRVFRCNGDLLSDFPDSSQSCITFYRAPSCDLTPQLPNGNDALPRYTAVSVVARTPEDVLSMLSNFSILNQIATEYAELLHLENCNGFEDE